jgi:hypothetical protein
MQSSANAQGLRAGSGYSVGTALTGIAVRDFDNDGRPDLVLIDNPGKGVTTTIHTLRGKSDGTFQSAIDSTGTPNLSAVAAGDFNGDGRQDIAVTDSVLNVVTVLLGNGDGTFKFTQSLPTGLTPVAMDAADINGDGAIDLVIANLGDTTLTILTGQGNGSFTPQPTMSAGSSNGPVGVVISDFNHDQIPDLAVALNTNARSILKGNGDGTFGNAITSTISGFTNPAAIKAVDFNQDGASDLIILTNNVLFLAGKNDGSFQTPVAFAAQDHPGPLAIADLNGDGYPDLIVGNQFSNSVTVLLGDGRGGVLATKNYGAVSPAGIGIGDFNSDGKLDLAISGTFSGQTNVQILQGDGDGNIQGAFNYVFQSGGSLGSNQGVLAADLNNDGRPDIIETDASDIKNDGNNRLTVLTNSGDYVFTKLPPTEVHAGILGGMAAARMTGSGNLDLIVAGFNTLSVLPGMGDGTFGTPLILNIENGFHVLAIGDFNLDGKLDVAFTRADPSDLQLRNFGVLLGKGNGTFNPLVTLGATGGVNGLTVGDFNGDGKPDIAAADVLSGGGPGEVDFFMGNGDGTFTIGATPFVGVYPGPMAAADLDGDGKLDLVVGNTGNGNAGSLTVLYGSGTGAFPTSVTFPLGSALTDLAVGDFDGDGFKDIAVTEGDGTTDIFRNQHNRTLAAPVQLLPGSPATFLIAADLNGGGVPDLVEGVGFTYYVLPNTGGTKAQFTSSQKPVPLGQQILFSVILVPSLPWLPKPTGSVSFSQNGNSLGAAPLSAFGVASVFASFSTTGTYSVQATYNGDANFFPHTLPSISQQITKKSASATLLPSSPVAVVGDPLSLSVAVTSASGLPFPSGNVSLLDGSSTVASTALDPFGRVSFNTFQPGVGIHTLTAKYDGDASYIPSTSAAVSEQIFAAADFVVSADSQDKTIKSGQSTVVTLNFLPTLHFTGPMTFSCSGLPALATCSFNPASISMSGAPASEIVTISTTAASSAVFSPSEPFSQKPRYEPFALLACLTFTLAGAALFSNRFRSMVGKAMLCAMAISAVLLSGCGGGGSSTAQPIFKPGTPAGTSTVAISASASTATGVVTHQVIVSLNVTP